MDEVLGGISSLRYRILEVLGTFPRNYGEYITGNF